MKLYKTITYSIADDHAIFRDGIKMSLNSSAHLKLLWEAENGKVLIEKLSTALPDILLLDIRMPLLDGIEALPIIKKDFEALKIIVLSMYDDPLTIRKCLIWGPMLILQKPQRPTKLLMPFMFV